MAIFKLTPVVEQLSDPAWEKSPPPHEACYVGAPDEREARLAAFSCLHVVQAVAADLKPKDSPWCRGDLTFCTEIVNFGQDMPDGMVYRASECDAPG